MRKPLGKTLRTFDWSAPTTRVQASGTATCGAFALVAAVEALTGEPSEITPYRVWQWMVDNHLATNKGSDDRALQAAQRHFWPHLWSNRAQWDNPLQTGWVETLVERSPFLLLTGRHWRTVVGHCRIKRLFWLGEATYLKIHDPLTGREAYEAAFKTNVATVLQIRKRTKL